MEISRREFLKYCGVSATAIGLSASELGWLEEAFADQMIPSTLLSDETTFDSQPSVLRAKDGTIWTAWVGTTDAKADNIYARRFPTKNPTWQPVERVTAIAGEYFRPALAQDSQGRIWIFWTSANANKPAGIYAALYENGKWSAPKPIATGKGPNLAHSVCSDANGKIWLAWQRFDKSSYDIYLKSFDGRAWSKEFPIAVTLSNEWNPVVAADSKGAVWVAWSDWVAVSVDGSEGSALYLASCSGGQVKSRTVVAADDGRYNINPSICVDSKDRVWLTWDSIKITDHGRSGVTTITGANLKGSETTDRAARAKVESLVKLVCFSDGMFEPRVMQGPNSMVPAEFADSHAGKPKVFVDEKDNVYLFHRAHTLRFGPKMFYWEAHVERYSGGAWLPPISLANSDGAQEDIGVIPVGKEGFLAVYQTEHRESFKGGIGPEEIKGVKHDPFVGFSDVNGDIYCANIPLVDGTTRFDEAMQLRSTSFGLRNMVVGSPIKIRHPVKIGGKAYNLYWGDLHQHTNVSGCTQGTEPNAEDRYVYGHDVLRYDFMAITDHAEHTSQYRWWRSSELADLYYVPGKFASLTGYEWTANFPIGHKNVIYPVTHAPLIRAKIDGSRTGHELWHKLEGHQAITIPHTTASKGMGADWSEDSPEFQRLVEVFQSARGACEMDNGPRMWFDVGDRVGFVQDGLAKGQKMGMICSSDHNYQTAYAVVYAEKLDREGVFEALYNRRCYGSTAYGTVIEFWSDGHFMGEEYKSSGSPKLELFASAPVDLRSVEIIKNGKVVYSQGGVDNPLGKKEIKVSWTDSEKITAPAYYYLRVVREDDEIAWSSPIWVEG
ncbi:MAG: DUF3604 domain-containing protein [Armatimonadota bacterium]|nr:DUF3604 domain-containing protein [Armatimonadota bacterium]